jgi:sigma-E factor negative regulatory protein RseA
MEQQARKQDPQTARMERLSALLDGECDAQEAAHFTEQWAHDPALRERWHAYHLIGDALRSDELGGQGHDAAFLRSLRQRLANEPAVLAPAPDSARRARWALPVSAAAGVLVIAGSVWMLPGLRPTGQSLGLALSGQNQRVALEPMPSIPTLAANNRSGDPISGNTPAQFNRYLSAHQQFQSAAAIAPVSGYMRHADYEPTSR